MTPIEALRKVFGFTSFRSGQEKAIEALVQGRDVLAVMPTGSGKSLCYQIPAHISRQRTVIVTPLVALIDDQVSALGRSGVNAEKIHSMLPREENVDAWKRFKEGSTKILYLSPERLMRKDMLEALDSLQIGMFVVDEAHCVSKWGPSFRPDYDNLSQLSARFPRATIAAFTATADEATRREVVSKLLRTNAITILEGFDRPNLFLAVEPKSHGKKQVLEFLQDKRGSPGIIYCLARKTTEELSNFLVDEGIKVAPYHAGMENSQRNEIHNRFMTEDGLVMVATIAFGMGIDKADVRFVIHFDLPSNMESYYQEIGRAGRDGAPAHTLLLWGLDNFRQRLRFIDDGGEDESHKIREKKRLDILLAYCEASSCRRKVLLSYFGEDIDACGNCDNCLNPPNVIDGTELCQKFLSAVARTKQSFGTEYIIDVLLGIQTERIIENGHENIKTFGIGNDHSKTFWRGFLRQAIAAGHVVINIQKYGILEITTSGWSILQGDLTCQYKEIRKERASLRTSASKNDSQEMDSQWSEADKKLFLQLKDLRLTLAREEDVPAYVIFHDKVLIEIIRNKPRTLTEFLELNGVGQMKLERYGELFLEVLSEKGDA